MDMSPIDRPEHIAGLINEIFEPGDFVSDRQFVFELGRAAYEYTEALGRSADIPLEGLVEMVGHIFQPVVLCVYHACCSAIADDKPKVLQLGQDHYFQPVDFGFLYRESMEKMRAGDGLKFHYKFLKKWIKNASGILTVYSLMDLEDLGAIQDGENYGVDCYKDLLSGLDSQWKKQNKSRGDTLPYSPRFDMWP